MFVAIIEVQPKDGRQQEYRDAASGQRSALEAVEGFVSIENFESVDRPGRFVAMSYWQDEDAVKRWREQNRLHLAQLTNQELLAHYRITIAEVERQYGTVS